jgi:hypothetical protein
MDEIIVSDDLEVWVQIVLDGKAFQYEVSNHGRIYSRHVKRVMSTWMRGSKQGSYHTVRLSYEGKKVTIDIHRLVAIHFIPNPDNKPEVNHINKDHNNNRASNLEWCTRQENEDHKRGYDEERTAG